MGLKTHLACLCGLSRYVFAHGAKKHPTRKLTVKEEVRLNEPKLIKMFPVTGRERTPEFVRCLSAGFVPETPEN